MDNVGFHRSPPLYSVMHKYSMEVLYTPVYSPMLNPIEYVNEFLKRKLRDEIKLTK